MAIETKQVEYAKEADEVLALVVALVKDIKAGKEVADIASGRLPDLMVAISGFDAIGDEVAANRKVLLSTLGSRMGELTDALLG